MTELEKISEATMRFMRGKYALDEVGNGKDEVKFRRTGKTILTISIREDCFVFMLVFGKAEREKFEARRNEFPQNIQDVYDNSKTFHDGKWMWFGVSDLETLEAVKELIMIKKKPNRKPFPKERAIYSKCGHRCDLCVHYSGGTISKEFKKELQVRIARVYSADGVGDSSGDWDSCPSCGEQDVEKPHPCIKTGRCEPFTCRKKKGVATCMECHEFGTCQPQAGLRGKIEAKSISADDVTWAILPYVDGQYGN